MPGEQFVIRVSMVGDQATVASAGRVSGAMQGMDASAKKAAASGAAASRTLAQKWTGAGNALTAAGRKTRLLSLGLAGLAVVTGKSAMDFNQAMTLVQTQAGASRQEVERLRGSVLDLAEASEFSPVELAEGLFRVESAGFRGAEAMKVLKSASDLAAVGQSSMEETTAALTAAMRSGIEGTESAAKTVGTLNAAVGSGSLRMQDLVGALSTGILPAAKSFGLTLRDVTAAIGLMTRTGVPANAAATRLRMTFSLMAAPTEGAAKALRGIGLSSTDLAKEMRGNDGLVSAVELLQDKLSGLSKIEQAQVISKIFGGGRTSSAITAMLQDVGTLGDIYETTGRKAGQFGKAVREQAETDSAKLKTAWSSVQVAMVKFGAEILPAVVPPLQSIAGAAGDAASAFSALPDGMQQTILMGGLLGIALSPVLSTLGAVARGIGGIIRVSQALAATNVATGIAQALRGDTAILRIAGSDMAGSLVRGLKVGLPVAAAAAGLGNIIYSATQGDWKAAGAKAGGALVGGIAGAFVGGPLGAAAGAGIGSFVGGLVGDLFKVERTLTPIQQRLRSTASELRPAFKAANDSADLLARSGKRVERSHARARRASQGLKGAEDALRRSRKRFGPDSQQAITAEGNLAIKRREATRAARQARTAERLHGLERKVAARVFRDTLATERERISTLQQERRAIIKQTRSAVEQGAGVDRLRRLQSRLKTNTEELTSARGKEARTLQQIAQQIGPKAARAWSNMSTSALKLSNISPTIREGFRKVIPASDSLTRAIRRFGDGSEKQGRRAEKSMGTLRDRGSKAMGSLAGSVYQADKNIIGNTTSMLKGFGATEIPGFRLTPPSVRKARGGTMRLRGAGLQDTVPLSVGSTPVMAAPGEDVAFITRHQRPELDYAVASTYGDRGLDGFFRRSDRPHFMAKGGIVKPGGGGAAALGVEAAQRILRKIGVADDFPLPNVAGPEPRGPGVGQASVNMVFAAAADYLRKHAGSPRVRKMIEFAEREAAKNYPYVYGGGHGRIGVGPYDCSGYVSAILNAGNFVSSPMTVAQGTGLYTFGQAGRGNQVTWGVRGTSGRSAHTMISLKDVEEGWRFFESGSGHGAAEVDGWAGAFSFRHPKGFKRGGILPSGRDAEKMPRRTREALARFGPAALEPTSPHFVGWGYDRGGVLRFAKGGSLASLVGGHWDNNELATLAHIASMKDPGRMAQKAQGESSGNERAIGHDPGGTRGLGLWQITTGVGNDDVISRYGGERAMLSAWPNAQAAKDIQAAQGFGAWYAPFKGPVGKVDADLAARMRAVIGGGGGAKEERVPAIFRGARTKALSFPSMPKTLRGVERELTRRKNELGRYRAAAKAASGKPKIQRAVQANVTALENRVKQLRRERSKLRREAAKRKITRRLGRQLGKITGFEQRIEAGERGYNMASQLAEQIVALEPQQPELPPTATDAQREAAERKYVAEFGAYVNTQERPAYEGVLTQLAGWRNVTLGGQRMSGHMQTRWEKEVRQVAAEIARINQMTKAAKTKEQKQAAKKARSKLPTLRHRDRELRRVIGEARGIFYPGRKRPVRPPVPPLAGTGSFEETLIGIQGTHWPDLHSPLPPAELAPPRRPGRFGGAIWETQGAIEELGLKINQASAGLAGGGGGESAAEAEAQARAEERARILEEENRRLQRELNITRAQQPVLGNFLGAYEKGGILPGDGFYLGHKGEEVVPADEVGQRGRVTVLEPVIYVSDELRPYITATVEQRFAAAGRSVGLGRGTPSAPGRRANLSGRRG